MVSITLKKALLFMAALISLSLEAAIAETITLKIAHNMSAPDGFCVSSILHEWPPYSEHRSYELGDKTQKTLNIEEEGIYFFTAQTIIYHKASGQIAVYPNGTEAISEESERVEYEVVQQSISENTVMPESNLSSGGASGGCFLVSW